MSGSAAAYDHLAVVSCLVTGVGNGVSALLLGLPGPGLIGMAALAVWIVLAFRRMRVMG